MGCPQERWLLVLRPALLPGAGNGPAAEGWLSDHACPEAAWLTAQHRPAAALSLRAEEQQRLPGWRRWQGLAAVAGAASPARQGLTILLALCHPFGDLRLALQRAESRARGLLIPPHAATGSAAGLGRWPHRWVGRKEPVPACAHVCPCL